MKILVTCPFGLSGILTSELKYLRCKPYDTFATWTYVDWDLELLYKINVWSRVANKVFIHMWSKPIFSFDELFDWVGILDWWKYISNDWLSISVYSKDSKLFSERSIQSITHKSILNKLWFDKKTNAEQVGEINDIFVRIENNQTDVFLNSSGRSLHNRWWRKNVGQAPLKENIAAALVLLSGWRFKEKLLDPFCGSGTILIEAAMIAKNIAPGLRRTFAFQKFGGYDKWLFDEIIDEAKSKIFEKEYFLFGSDIDEQMISYAKENAKSAWVEECIQRRPSDFLQSNLPEEYFVVSNPPYGKRLELDMFVMQSLYKKLVEDCVRCGGGFLTSYSVDEFVRDQKVWKKKQVNNNGEMCSFWRKK